MRLFGGWGHLGQISYEVRAAESQASMTNDLLRSITIDIIFTRVSSWIYADHLVDPVSSIYHETKTIVSIQSARHIDYPDYQESSSVQTLLEGITDTMLGHFHQSPIAK